MKVQRTLQISVAALIAIGCWLFLLGHPGRMLPMLAVLAAAVSLLVTDMGRWVRLPRLLGNLLALAAAVYSLSSFFDSNNYGQLLAIADLLVWLQILLLFQEKNDRVYGELMVLSLLLVVVAAALEQRLAFGLLLGPYVAVGITAMCALFVYRETARFASDRPTVPRRALAFASGTGSGARWINWLFRGAAINGSRVVASTPLAGGPDSSRGRAPSPCGGPPEVSFARRREWLTAPLAGRVLWQQVLGLWLASVVFALAVFYATPRPSDSPWFGAGGRRARVGFSPQVSFTQFRRVAQTNEPVMRVTFVDVETGEPYTVFGEPYFRGGVLTEYRSEQKTWRASGDRRNQSGRPLVYAASESVVRQKVVLRTRGQALLFAVFPAYANEQTPPLSYETLSGRLWPVVAEESDSALPYQYELDTTAFRDGIQSSAVPLDDALDGSREGRLSESVLGELTKYESEEFANLRRIAAEVIADSGVDRDDPVAVARALEVHFHNRDLYKYSLDLGIVSRKNDLDPIEDFVANHRTGHCEYFASALVLMLRSQGIPARLVNGYLGGDYNTVGHYWQVRQRDAHAWVEAYIEPDRAADLLGDAAPPGIAAWLRLDPTPSEAAREAREDENSLWTRAGHALDYAELLWNDYVMGLNSNRQQSEIYSPLADGAARAVAGIFDAEAWNERVARVAQWFGIDPASARLASWWNWRVLALVAVSCLALIGLWRFARRKRSGKRSDRATRRGQRRSHASHVDYYRRLTALLARNGMRRATGQTPREFAHEVAARIAKASHLVLADAAAAKRSTDEHDIAERIPVDIVEVYYGERYGGRPAAARDREAIEAALDRLQRALEGSLLAAKARR